MDCLSFTMPARIPAALAVRCSHVSGLSQSLMTGSICGGSAGVQLPLLITSLALDNGLALWPSALAKSTISPPSWGRSIVPVGHLLDGWANHCDRRGPA